MSGASGAFYGRLGSDPRAIETRTGKPMTVGNLAVDLPDRTQGADEGASHTLWLNVAAFGRAAEDLARCRVGQCVSVSGAVAVLSIPDSPGRATRRLSSRRGYRRLRGIATSTGRRAQAFGGDGIRRSRGERSAAVVTARNANGEEGANPYRIPAGSPWFHVVNVSGGRSSGMLLHRILEAHDGQLPERCAAIFANTGRERGETLDFVEAMGEAWDVPIEWVEFDYRPDRDGGHGTKYRARVVDRATASMNGEPFDCNALRGLVALGDAASLYGWAESRDYRPALVANPEADETPGSQADRLPAR